MLTTCKISPIGESVGFSIEILPKIIRIIYKTRVDSTLIWIHTHSDYWLFTASIRRLTPSSSVFRGQAIFMRINNSPSSP